jgi:hypothetical protein
MRRAEMQGLALRERPVLPRRSGISESGRTAPLSSRATGQHFFVAHAGLALPQNGRGTLALETRFAAIGRQEIVGERPRP